MSPHLVTRISLAFGLALAMFQCGRAAADHKALDILMVIDTNAGKRGGDVNLHRACAEYNLKTWRTLIDGVYGSGPLFKDRMTLNVLRDDQVSPENIRRFYNRLPVNKDRALLFIYSGHGGIGARGQFLATSGGDIARSEIHQLMTGRGAPGVFILTDCCSNYSTMAEESSGDAGQAKSINTQAFYQLFYQTSGVVEITAAQPGEIAFLGLFTSAAAECFYSPSNRIRRDGKNGRVTWNDYFSRVQSDTSTRFTTARNAAPANDFIKTVQWQMPSMSNSTLTQRPTETIATTFRPAIEPPTHAEDPGESKGRIEITSDP